MGKDERETGDPDNISSDIADHYVYYAVLRGGRRAEVWPSGNHKDEIYRSATEINNPLLDVREKQHAEYIKSEYERLLK